MKQGCYYLNSFLQAKEKCLEEAVMILVRTDPPAEGPYAAGRTAAEMQGWERCLHSGSIQCGRACQKAKLHFLRSHVSVPESDHHYVWLSGSTEEGGCEWKEWNSF